MKIFICGDIHEKHELIDKAIELSKKHGCDHTIFLGDYLDDFDTSDEDLFQTVLKINEVARYDNVTALLGNHELSYLEDQRCPGYNPTAALLMGEYFNRGSFKIAYQVDDWLITHAGLTQAWSRYAQRLNITPNSKHPTYVTREKGENYADWLNRLWETYPGIFKSIGKERGGYGIGSPLWADFDELSIDAIEGVNQIVGHTPTIAPDINWSERRSKLINLDVWSNQGSGGFAIFEDGEITLLDSTGSVIDQATWGSP